MEITVLMESFVMRVECDKNVAILKWLFVTKIHQKESRKSQKDAAKKQ